MLSASNCSISGARLNLGTLEDWASIGGIAFSMDGDSFSFFLLFSIFTALRLSSFPSPPILTSFSFTASLSLAFSLFTAPLFFLLISPPPSLSLSYSLPSPPSDTMDISTGFDVFERSDPFEDIDPFAEFNERLNRIHLEAPPGSKFDFFHNIKLGIFHPAPSDMADKAMVAGDKALEKGEVLQSIYWYTLALNHEPRGPAAYILRSIAYTRLKPEHGGPKYQAAMEDAEVALVLASDRGRREYYLASQFRRAICLYQFGRLGDAAWLLQRLDDSIKKEESSPSPSAKFNFRRPISLWAVKLKVLGAKKTEGDPKWDVTVPEVNRSVYMPSVEVLKAQLESAKAALSPAQNVVTPDKTYSAPLYTYTDCSEEPGKAPEKESDKFSIREEWYQTRFEVVVNLFVQPMKFDGTKIEVKFTEMDVSTLSDLSLIHI